MKSLKYIIPIAILTIAVIAASIIGCSKREGFGINIIARNSSLESTDKFGALDTLLVGIDGLEPGRQYEISILHPNGGLISKAKLTASPDGAIPPTALWYDIGLVGQGATANGKVGEGEIDTDVINISAYKIVLKGVGVDVQLPFFIISKAQPIAWASDNAGKLENAFVEGTAVYVSGKQFTANTTVKLYVVEDKDEWANGDTLTDVSETVDTADIDANGNLPTTQVWTATAIELTGANADGITGKFAYDIVVDVDADGVYDAGTDALDNNVAPGFVVQQTYTAGDILLQLASAGYLQGHWTIDGGYQDSYKKDGSNTGRGWQLGKAIYVVWNPYIQTTFEGPPPSEYDPQTYMWQGPTVRVYVCLNKIWTNGDTLVDVLGGYEELPVQYGCANGWKMQAIWYPPFESTVATTDNKFDVVVDMDKDGVYTAGVDFVDGVNTNSYSNQIDGINASTTLDVTDPDVGFKVE